MVKRLKKEEYIKIRVLKVHQNLGDFYIGVASAKDVVEICQAEERRKVKDNLEEYFGMQRPLSPERVRELKKYVETEDATFPNSIILSLDIENPESFYEEGDFVYVKKDKKSSNILDGQHRLSAFVKGGQKDFELIVTLFPDLSIEDQAYLFSVINSKQSKINSSLAQELYDLAVLETPEKIIHTLTLKFNDQKTSPWKNMIKRLGRKTRDTEILSQSAFAKGILNLISNPKDSYTIRNFLKKNENKREGLNKEFDYDPKKKIFWEPYVEYREDFMYTVLSSYFLAVSRAFKDEWGDSDYILTKTTGYNAIMKLFEVLFSKGLDGKDLSYEYFYEKLKSLDKKKLKPLISKNYNPGGQGEAKLFRDLLDAMGINI